MTQLSYIGIRMKAAWVVLVLIFAYLAYHMYTVQILRHDELYAKAKSKYTAVKTSRPPSYSMLQSIWSGSPRRS